MDHLKNLFVETDSAYDSAEDISNIEQSKCKTTHKLCQCQNHTYIKELQSTVKYLIDSVMKLTKKVDDLQEQKEANINPIQIVKNVDTQTKNSEEDVVPNKDDHTTLPEISNAQSQDFLSAKPKVALTDLDIYVNEIGQMQQMYHFGNDLKELTASTVRANDKSGYIATMDFLHSIEKVSECAGIRKKLFLMKTNNELIYMIGGMLKVDSMTYDQLKEKILDISTRPDEIETLQKIYNFHWDGKTDPYIFAGQLRKMYELNSEIPNLRSFHHFMKRNVTHLMLDEQKYAWSAYFDIDTMGTLSKIADIYHDKGREYFFGKHSHAYHKEQHKQYITVPHFFYYPIYYKVY